VKQIFTDKPVSGKVALQLNKDENKKKKCDAKKIRSTNQGGRT